MIELSLVIPTRERSDALCGLLRALCDQTLDARRFEVLVVDNGTRGEMRHLPAGLQGRPGGLRSVHEPEVGLHCARHRGWREAQASVLVFADDDIEPEPTWLESVLGAFADPGTMLAGGPVRPRFAADPPLAVADMWRPDRRGRRMLGHLSILDLGQRAGRIAPDLVWGCNFGVRREVLEQCEGFHPDGFPGDRAMLRGDGETWVSDWVAATGGVAVYVPGASVRHVIPAGRLSVSYLRERSWRQGVSDSFTLARHRLVPDRPCPRAGQLRRELVLKRIYTALPWRSRPQRVRRALFRASLRGYRHHAQCVQSEPGLRAWVSRCNYLDAATPQAAWCRGPVAEAGERAIQAGSNL